jgi:RNA polymerase sigma-70 factor, ECF subfamily
MLKSLCMMVEMTAEPARRDQAAAADGGAPVSSLELARRKRRITAELEYLTGLARKLCRGQLDADDLVQDVMASALARVADLDHNVNIGAWLTRVMKNKFIDRCRRRRVRDADRDGADADTLVAPEAEAPEWWESLGADDVRRAAEQLPDELRTTYSLHAFDHLGYQEIATRLGIPRATVATRLRRARLRLQAILTRRPGDSDD